jgi:hypothetical protein
MILITNLRTKELKIFLDTESTDPVLITFLQLLNYHNELFCTDAEEMKHILLYKNSKRNWGEKKYRMKKKNR